LPLQADSAVSDMRDHSIESHEDSSTDGSSFLRDDSASDKKGWPKVFGRSQFSRSTDIKSGIPDRLLVGGGLALLLFPILAVAALTPDLPLRWFDGWISSASLKPSSWVTVADFWFLISMFVMILMARRVGGDLVSHAQGFAWLILVVASFAMIVLLAPTLTAEDLPNGRPILGLALAWYAGPLVAVQIYVLTRGGQWWRAPLLGGLFGVIVQTSLYFPIAFPQTGVPWLLWWAMDLTIKTFAVALFVLFYGAMRRRIVPRPYLGGR